MFSTSAAKKKSRPLATQYLSASEVERAKRAYATLSDLEAKQSSAEMRSLINEAVELKNKGKIDDEAFTQLASIFIARHIESEVQRKFEDLFSRQLNFLM